MRRVLAGRWAALSATGRAVVLAAGVGFFVLLAAWFAGPGLFAAADEVPEQVVEAKVTEPAPCTDANAQETVTWGEDKRSAVLRACGHKKGEALRVAVPAEQDAAMLTVRSVETDKGYNSTRRGIGLLLMALASAAGALYAFVLARRRRPLRNSMTHRAPIRQ